MLKSYPFFQVFWHLKMQFANFYSYIENENG